MFIYLANLAHAVARTDKIDFGCTFQGNFNTDKYECQSDITSDLHLLSFLPLDEGITSRTVCHRIRVGADGQKRLLSQLINSKIVRDRRPLCGGDGDLV